LFPDAPKICSTLKCFGISRTGTRWRYARRVFNQPEGQASSPFEPPPWAGQPAPPAKPGQEYGAPGDPAYPTYQPPNVQDHSQDQQSGKAEGVPLEEAPEAPKEAEVVDLVAALRASVEREPASAVGLVLTLVGLAVTSLMWWFPMLLPLVPTLIVNTMALLVAVVGAILVGRAVARLGRVHAILGLLTAGAAAAISVTFLLAMMTDPPQRDWWTCRYHADTLEQQNACDVAYNTARWDG
jgi:hypothetical protein